MSDTVQCWDCGAIVDALHASAHGPSGFECDNCRDRHGTIAALTKQVEELQRVCNAILQLNEEDEFHDCHAPDESWQSEELRMALDEARALVKPVSDGE